jgi:hypothetical protein
MPSKTTQNHKTLQKITVLSYMHKTQLYFSPIYSQPLLYVASLCNFSLQQLAGINTQNSLSTSNLHYSDSASDKISYPWPVTNFYSPRLSISIYRLLQYMDLKGLIDPEGNLGTSPTSPCLSCSLQSVSTITIFWPIR